MVGIRSKGAACDVASNLARSEALNSNASFCVFSIATNLLGLGLFGRNRIFSVVVAVVGACVVVVLESFVVFDVFSSLMLNLLDFTFTSFGLGIMECDSTIRGRLLEIVSKILAASCLGEVLWRKRRIFRVVVGAKVVVVVDVVVRIRFLRVVRTVEELVGSARGVSVAGTGTLVVRGLWGRIFFFDFLIGSSLAISCLAGSFEKSSWGVEILTRRLGRGGFGWEIWSVAVVFTASCGVGRDSWIGTWILISFAPREEPVVVGSTIFWLVEVSFEIKISETFEAVGNSSSAEISAAKLGLVVTSGRTVFSSISNALNGCKMGSGVSSLANFFTGGRS